MCHFSGFQKILDINYTRIGLSINEKFSLGKWLSTRQKTIQSRSQEIQNHARSYRMRAQKYYYCIRRKLPWLNFLIPCTIQSLQKLCLNFLRKILTNSSNGVVLGQNSRHTAGIIS